MRYEVRLQAFEGPIDLLLHLITRQRVDIYDISLATITEDYLAAVARMDELDLESATGFLVVAATLLELKAARLLPAASEDARTQLLEERDLLLARLVECATYRDAGTWLAGRLEEGARLHGRAVALEDSYVGLAPDLIADISMDSLARVAARLLAPQPPAYVDISHLPPLTASVRDAMEIVAGHLSGGTRATFEDLCGRDAARIDVVVRFLALLELFKAGAIDLVQDDRFGSIRALWTGDVSLDEALADAEEYVVEGEAR